MNLETTFALSGLLVMPFWALMAFLPHWRLTKRIIQSPLIIAPPALLYGLLVLPELGGVLQAVSNPTLEGITLLMSNPAAVTIAWVHFLAFDLFVGRWIYLDSREQEISAWFIAPVLYLTLMLGPVGFITYLIVRLAVGYFRGNRSLTAPLKA